MNDSLDLYDFQIETIQSKIKTLYQEKSKLQQKLKELNVYRGQVEETLEKVTSKLNQTNERHFKMIDTKRAATLKAETMEKTAKQMENINVQMRAKIEEIENLLQEEKKQQLEAVENFEVQCQQLFELFFNAQDFYAANNLAEQMKKTEQELVKLKDLKHEQEVILKQRTALLENLENTNSNEDFELKMENYEIALNIFKEENKLSAEALSILKKRKSEIEKMFKEK